ncbi:MAG: imidazole glycerol phosphate synthase subunit HisH, partial [Thermodesulfobacteriota bacterium]
MGNLFSVRHACDHAGMEGVVTSSRGDILDSDVVILPGVGAFGDAMANLEGLGLADLLRGIALSGKPFLGVCLGMQLLMSESYEFGRRAGLGIVPGKVLRLENRIGESEPVKVPQVCWNALRRVERREDPWEGTPMRGFPDGVFMYFVHSYYVKPEDDSVSIAVTRHGAQSFCSALRLGNIFACQCHPERSGPRGLEFYRNLAGIVKAYRR